MSIEFGSEYLAKISTYVVAKYHLFVQNCDSFHAEQHS